MKPVLFLTALLGLSACDPGAESRRTDAAQAAEVQDYAPIRPVVLTSSGAGESVAADMEDGLQWSAGVVELDALRADPDTTIKLFGTAGGDPAMNGLYTYIAFYVSPADGWRVFRIGDFLDYRILGEQRGRVDLEVQESVLDPATDEIGSRTRRLIVEWDGDNGAGPPETISVTPAA